MVHEESATCTKRHRTASCGPSRYKARGSGYSLPRAATLGRLRLSRILVIQEARLTRAKDVSRGTLALDSVCTIERENEMPTRRIFTRSQIADLLNVPPLFVRDPPDESEANRMAGIFSETAVCIVAIGRELLGALDPAETACVVDQLWKWKPTSPWGWLLVYDGDPLEIVHTTEQDAADLAVHCKGFRCRLHLDPLISEVLERIDAFRGE